MRQDLGSIGSVGRPWRRGESLTARLLAVIDRTRSRQEAQGLAEYALILALIAVVAIIALIFLGSQVSTLLSTVGNSV